ncbi:helix-turn-helix transcriptional regulator [Vibrio vulnificus]|uniref:helix-turn-helix domain-containing protein n=1 Tax=Vibrio vulnificus TaxID=672 RepID=UPI001A24886D|nr:XRE family transcriptional regulator [Vibrio vulnificus]HAS6222319.1 XRE family transcriptional regulator [Vibrio vulnificus]
MKFSDFLLKVRTDKSLSQRALVEHLSTTSEALSRLDITTLSRWERGVTKPTLNKQFLIARLMGYDVVQLLRANHTESLLSINKKLDKLISRVLNPYLSDSTDFKLIRIDSLKDNPNICEKLCFFHNEYLGLKLDADFFRKSNLHADIYVNDTGELVGHFIYGYLSRNTDLSILSLEKGNEVNFIHKSDTDATQLYAVSMFSSLSKPRALNILSILELLRKNTSVSSLIINCHSQDAFDLYETTQELTILRKGKRIKNGGVNLFSKHYRYVQIRVKPEEILASKLVYDVLPYSHTDILNLIS